MAGTGGDTNNAFAIEGDTDNTRIGNTGDRLRVETSPSSGSAGSYNRQTGNGTTTVKSGAGTLIGIIINNDNTGGTFTVYDNTAGSGTIIMGAVQMGTPSGGLLSSTGLRGPNYLGTLNIAFTTGLTVVRAGDANNNITVIYR